MFELIYLMSVTFYSCCHLVMANIRLRIFAISLKTWTY